MGQVVSLFLPFYCRLLVVRRLRAVCYPPFGWSFLVPERKEHSHLLFCDNTTEHRTVQFEKVESRCVALCVILLTETKRPMKQQQDGTYRRPAYSASHSSAAKANKLVCRLPDPCTYVSCLLMYCHDDDIQDQRFVGPIEDSIEGRAKFIRKYVLRVRLYL
uniref:Putative secreted protein n=1 Tax=Anopheles marajoara TaxID=58244 RepID=A0A2M4C640_9DIPT